MTIINRTHDNVDDRSQTDEGPDRRSDGGRETGGFATLVFAGARNTWVDVKAPFELGASHG